MEILIKKNSAEIWKLKGVESNALSLLVEVVNHSLEKSLEAKYDLAEIINICTKLPELIENDSLILDKLIKNLPEKYSSQRSALKAAIENKPVYRYVKRDRTGPLSLGLPDDSPFSFMINFSKQYVKNEPTS